MALSNAEIIAAIKEKKLSEIVELVKMMEEEFGVSAAPVAAAVAVPGAAAAAAPAAEEQTEFTVILKGFGADKIKVIKEIRTINPSLGLKEAKEVVDKTPSELVKDVSKAEAEKIKAQIEAVGGKVEIK